MSLESHEVTWSLVVSRAVLRTTSDTVTVTTDTAAWADAPDSRATWVGWRVAVPMLTPCAWSSAATGYPV